MNIKNLDKFIFDIALSSLDISFDVSKWAKNIGIDLYSNQLEIVESICRPDIDNIAVIGSRSMGKTFSVAVASIKQCLSVPGYGVIIFAPKLQQAQKLLHQINLICKRSKRLRDEVDWDATSQKRLTFKNGSLVEALSANEHTENEGWHGDLGIIDEAHRVSDDVFKKRIIPMFAGSRNPKLVKIGITMYNNHFKDSFDNPAWLNLVYPWNKCPYLYRGKLVEIDGVEYPKLIIDYMPLSMKIKRFPDHPEVHYPSTTKMLEEDFNTQFEMVWCDDINLFLNEAEFDKIVGNHDILDKGDRNEEYYFGLDFAGGAEIAEDDEHDYTSLTILRKTDKGVKELVAVYEWQGDLSDQKDEIIAIVHPKTGLFPCKQGAADYGNMGAPIVDIMNKCGVRTKGILYKTAVAGTGKNFKNAMFDQLLFELRSDKLKYPKEEQMEKHKLFTKHFTEWHSLERRKNNTLNSVIESNDADVHDDTCNSVALAIWAAEFSKVGAASSRQNAGGLPKPVIGIHSSVNRGNSTGSRYIRGGNL